MVAETQLNRIYKSLKRGAIVDITSMAKEEYKEYEITPGGEKLLTRMTLQMRSKTDPIIIAERYRGSQVIENHWYYLDQLYALKSLLNLWLNKL